MKSNPGKSIEEQILKWEKGLYACYGAAFTLLINAIIKAVENTKLTEVFFFIEGIAGATNSPIFSQYYTDIGYIMISPWRLVLWAVLEITSLVLAIILIVHPVWRHAPSNKRLNLIYGYLLASWITLLTLGAQDPLNVGSGYNILVVGYLLAIGLGYWLSHRKKERVEEIFP